MKHMSVNLSSLDSFQSPPESYRDHKIEEHKKRIFSIQSATKILDFRKKSDSRHVKQNHDLVTPAAALKSDREK